MPKCPECGAGVDVTKDGAWGHCASCELVFLVILLLLLLLLLTMLFFMLFFDDGGGVCLSTLISAPLNVT